MAKSKHYYIRKSHRWLGLFLGIQFFLWTLGGLYFSWSSIDDVHGDPLKKHAPLIASDVKMVSPTVVLDHIRSIHRIDSIVSIQLIELLGSPYYQIRCISALTPSSKGHSMHDMTHLANAITGKLRGPLNRDEAIKVAQSRFNGEGTVREVTYLTNTDAHHEYRENPLPAYAVSFVHPTRATVYVSTDLGTVQKYRNDQWRLFDLFWMLHTMDYQGRDNFGNILLRICSVLGMFTILSGFILFFISMKTGRSKKIKTTIKSE